MENTKILFEKENELMLLNDKCERMMSEVFLFDNRIAEMVLEVSKAKEKVALAIEGIIPVLLQFWFIVLFCVVYRQWKEISVDMWNFERIERVAYFGCCTSANVATGLLF